MRGEMDAVLAKKAAEAAAINARVEAMRSVERDAIASPGRRPSTTPSASRRRQIGL